MVLLRPLLGGVDALDDAVVAEERLAIMGVYVAGIRRGYDDSKVSEWAAMAVLSATVVVEKTRKG